MVATGSFSIHLGCCSYVLSYGYFICLQALLGSHQYQTSILHKSGLILNNSSICGGYYIHALEILYCTDRI